MHARVPAADHGEAALAQRRGELAIVEDVTEVALHLLTVTRDEEVLPRCEEALGVVPRSGDERDATGQRLERSDRRDPGKSLDIGSARHVNGDSVCGERRGHEVVRLPAA